VLCKICRNNAIPARMNTIAEEIIQKQERSETGKTHAN
jgi:hypothetical protein